MRAFLCVLLLGGLRAFVAAPTMNEGRFRSALSPFHAASRHSVLRKRFTDMAPLVDVVESLLLGPPEESSAPTESVPAVTNDPGLYPFSFSIVSSAQVTQNDPTITVTTTEEDTVTVLVPAAPTTATVTDTITVTQVATAVPVPAPSSAYPPEQTGVARSVWEAPKTLVNLDSFKVAKFATGEKNFKIVTGIPAAASAAARPIESSSASSVSIFSVPEWDNASSAFEVLYPSGTIDPAHSPVGGAGFYAAPIPPGNANSATLRYSAFIPADFDWVRGGKMPGLYGGHEGCSGGNAAVDCFSTRLMWRADGAGELYLYAPKDKQTKELCGDPQSVCDAAYGLSVGRGAFFWLPGAWTTVEQTVTLNTPGKQDGGFELRVNGERKILRNDVFYRDVIGNNGGKKGGKTTTTRKGGGKPTSTVDPMPTSTDDSDPLGPILTPIIGGLGLRAASTGLNEEAGARSTDTDSGCVPHTVARRDLKSLTVEISPAPTPTPGAVARPNSSAAITHSHTSFPLLTTPIHRAGGVDPGNAALDVSPDGNSEVIGAESVLEGNDGEQVKFVGIFFSTFFGGHEPEYATPRDQRMWFKDFALSYDS